MTTRALLHLRNKIEATAISSGRNPNSVTLIAVSKTVSSQQIEAFCNEGQVDFGENKVQEGIDKFQSLKKHYPIRLHLIGPLQTNKVRHAIKWFDVIHTLDRPTLATELKKEMARANKIVPCLIQVNIANEPQKSGIPLAEADAFIESCTRDFGLPIIGLMCIPPISQDPSPFFRVLRTMADQHGLQHCSMGMSQDFEQAINAGATYIRVGSALFGHRI